MPDDIMPNTRTSFKPQSASDIGLRVLAECALSMDEPLAHPKAGFHYSRDHSSENHSSENRSSESRSSENHDSRNQSSETRYSENHHSEDGNLNNPYKLSHKAGPFKEPRTNAILQAALVRTSSSRSLEACLPPIVIHPLDFKAWAFTGNRVPLRDELTPAGEARRTDSFVEMERLPPPGRARAAPHLCLPSVQTLSEGLDETELGARLKGNGKTPPKGLEPEGMVLCRFLSYHLPLNGNYTSDLLECLERVRSNIEKYVDRQRFLCGHTATTDAERVVIANLTEAMRSHELDFQAQEKNAWEDEIVKLVLLDKWLET